jgi:hypothetical protein
MAPAALPLPRLPRRDAAAREQLDSVARGARPLVLARDRAVALPASPEGSGGAAGGLAALVPGGAVVRGSVLRVAGEPGAGSTTVAFELAAAFTALGEWAAAVDCEGTLGALAASEAGVALERFAVVRRVPPARWATVVAALLDGVSLVVAEVPRGVGLGDARRLVARARERESVLVACETRVRWPAEARFAVYAETSEWDGLGADAGFLAARRLHVRVEGRGAATRSRTGELARAV